jgi:transposase
MAYLGLKPSEHSSGTAVRRGGITKAGNALARHVLIEGAWTYRMQARVSRKLHDRLDGLPQTVRDIAWKAQVRLCARYRRLTATGKAKVIVTTAIAREMVGFLWAIACQTQVGSVA